MSDAGLESTARTTGEVLARLERLGLDVTLTMVEDDTAAHYLPPRETAYRGRGGASGLWEPWIERRAERLYRLRSLHRRTGLGPTGDVLRLFLLFHDGWGWDHVRKTCIQGYQLNVRAARQGVKNRVRSKELTLDNLVTLADDIAQEQYKPKDPNQAQIDRVAVTIGLTEFGVAPNQRIGTLEKLTSDLFPEADPAVLAEHQQLAPLMWSTLSMKESDAIHVLQGDVAPDVMERAIETARELRWRVRALFRRIVKPQGGIRRIVKPQGGKRPSLNPLTFFGAVTRVDFRKALRQMPLRATPAQYLGGQFAEAVVLAYRERQMIKLYPFWLEWFANWLQSEDGRKSLQSMEREVNQSN